MSIIQSLTSARGQAYTQLRANIEAPVKPSVLGPVLRFTVDEESAGIVIWVVNRKTGALVHRIPMDEVKALFRDSEHTKGQLVSTLV